MKCHIIAIVMDIILSVMGKILSTAQRHIIGKILSVIGWGIINTNVYEYAVNKHACPTDVTLQSVAMYMKIDKVTCSLSQFHEH